MKSLVFLTVALLPALSASAQPSMVPLERPLVFVPGLLGSRLCHGEPGDPGGATVVWGTLAAMRHFPSLAVDGVSDEISPCGLIREISFLGLYSQDLYAPFVRRLEAEGYREGETLFIFDYDWRLSVFDGAARLASFIDPAVRANFLVGGLADFRRTFVSFPSTFELMPRYEGCCGGVGESPTAFDGDEPMAWTALGWDGIEATALPDPFEARLRQVRLRRIGSTPLPASIDEMFLVGVDHRTPARYAVDLARGSARPARRRALAHVVPTGQPPSDTLHG